MRSIAFLRQQIAAMWLLRVNDLRKAVIVCGGFGEKFFKIALRFWIRISRISFEENREQQRRENLSRLTRLERGNARGISANEERTRLLLRNVIAACRQIDVQPASLRKHRRINL